MIKLQTTYKSRCIMGLLPLSTVTRNLRGAVPQLKSLNILNKSLPAKMSVDIKDMRKAYKNKSEVFLEDNIPIKEPISQFKLWFDQICTEKKIHEPNAMCLATATKDGKPSARYVLLKGYGKEGFKFFTHYDSRKGKELEENPIAALTFYWDVYERSIRIEGAVKKLEFSEADDYFQKRPKTSQIGALASKQSTVIAGRQVLVEKEKELTEKYVESPVPRPPLWGGYILVPEVIEFWQGQTDRLHDRIRFRKPGKNENIDGNLVHEGEDGWVYERLSP